MAASIFDHMGVLIPIEFGNGRLTVQGSQVRIGGVQKFGHGMSDKMGEV